MNFALAVDRLQFAFTITFHYLFPQLTMGLALLIFVLKTIAWRATDERRRVITTPPRASGSRSSPSISPPAWSPEFPWSFNSAPIGRSFRAWPEA